MNGRMNKLRKRIDRLNQKTVTREEEGIDQYLTQEQLAVLEYARKRRMAYEAERREDREKK